MCSCKREKEKEIRRDRDRKIERENRETDAMKTKRPNPYVRIIFQKKIYIMSLTKQMKRKCQETIIHNNYLNKSRICEKMT